MTNRTLLALCHRAGVQTHRHWWIIWGIFAWSTLNTQYIYGQDVHGRLAACQVNSTEEHLVSSRFKLPGKCSKSVYSPISSGLVSSKSRGKAAPLLFTVLTAWLLKAWLSGWQGSRLGPFLLKAAALNDKSRTLAKKGSGHSAANSSKWRTEQNVAVV